MTRPQERQRCPYGHRLEAPNLVAHAAAKGYRECLACNRARGSLRHRADRKDVFHLVADSRYEKIMKEQNNG